MRLRDRVLCPQVEARRCAAACLLSASLCLSCIYRQASSRGMKHPAADWVSAQFGCSEVSGWSCGSRHSGYVAVFGLVAVQRGPLAALTSALRGDMRACACVYNVCVVCGRFCSGRRETKNRFWLKSKMCVCDCVVPFWRVRSEQRATTMSCIGSVQPAAAARDAASDRSEVL